MYQNIYLSTPHFSGGTVTFATSLLWVQRPQVNVRSHASSVLHDKLIVFGGVRDKAGQNNTNES
jgi:hypothetical protein